MHRGSRGLVHLKVMMALILRGEDAKDWVYKGEGAANLVLSYIGSSSSMVGKVLRIKKVVNGEVPPANGCLVLSKVEQCLWGGFKELVESTSLDVAGQVYVKQVMSPLLDPKHIDGGVRIIVCREFLEGVKKNVSSQRPAWRIDAAEVDVDSDSALLISDHSLFLYPRGTLKEDMCFAIEIKPKCGFLPSSEFIASKNDIKKCISRFRMHQLYKLHEGEISVVSDYDPLDLFSASKDRVHQAITALFRTPGNNFRMFFNGSLVFGGLGGNMDITAARAHEAHEKINALLKVYGLQLANLIELLVEALLKSTVLEKLLAAQKLDLLDIEGAIHLYYNIVSEPCIVCKDIINTDLWHQYTYLHSLPLEVSLTIVREYLIAATAKDCSLMLSFRPTDVGSTVTDDGSIFLKSCNQSFDYKAKFIDLDLKPIGRMGHYYKLDQKIVDCYIKNFMTQEKACARASGCTEGKQMQSQH